ncbi:hypothetical protein JOB18_042170 [Solea senegalensis]|uniref:Uncharacterized protein n=1 Tax=Solea senegalensis TaxID=28829 RepID=A0AAV6PYT4_SOLSE|nr:hypothetical protein JOB18_042170 [Solea senegalensis]
MTMNRGQRGEAIAFKPFQNTHISLSTHVQVLTRATYILTQQSFLHPTPN